MMVWMLGVVVWCLIKILLTLPSHQARHTMHGKVRATPLPIIMAEDSVLVILLSNPVQVGQVFLWFQW